MRLWLDEMIRPEVALGLRRRGYDAVGVQEPPQAWARGIPDDDQLQAAVRLGRVLVTYNIGDFVLLSRRWADARRTHHGIILISAKTIPPGAIGRLVRSLAAMLDERPEDEALRDQIAYLPPPRRSLT